MSAEQTKTGQGLIASASLAQNERDDHESEQSRTVTQEVHSCDEELEGKKSRNSVPESDQYVPQIPTNQSFDAIIGSRAKDQNGSSHEPKSMSESKVMSEGHTGDAGQSDENKSSNEISAGKSTNLKIDQNAGQRKKYVRKNVTCFDKELDSKLLVLVKELGETAWSRISKILGKSEIKCHKRFLELSDRSHMANAPWSKEEDEILTKIVTQNGARDWTGIAMSLPGRIGKQCRERWHHHLSPEVVKRKWTLEEDLLIVKLYREHNARWSEMAKFVPGRTDNQIKNRYNSNLKKRFQDKEFVRLIENQEVASARLSKSNDCDQSADSVTFEGNDNMPNAAELRAIPSHEILSQLRFRKNFFGNQQQQQNDKSPIVKVNKWLEDVDDENIQLVFSCKQRRVSKINFKQQGALTPSKPLTGRQYLSPREMFEQMSLGETAARTTPNRKQGHLVDASSSQYQQFGSSCQNPNRMDSAWATPQTSKNSKQYVSSNYCFTPFEEQTVPEKLAGCYVSSVSPWSSSKLMTCDQSTMGNTVTYANTNTVTATRQPHLLTYNCGEKRFRQNEVSSSSSAHEHTSSILNATMALAQHQKKAPKHISSEQVVDPCFKMLDKILDEGEAMPAYQVLAISTRPGEDQNSHQQFAYCIPMWSDKN